MNKLELLDIISELIINNSNIEAEEDDAVFIDNLEEVMLNIGEDDGDVTLLFSDGGTAKIIVESVTNPS